MTESEIRYTRAADGMRIAYQFVPGTDPVILEAPVMGLQINLIEEVASWRGYREAFAGEHAFAMVGYRGSGLSGRFEDPPEVAEFALDVSAVAAALEGREVVVATTGSGVGPVAEFLASDPPNVRGLLYRDFGGVLMPAPLLALLRQDVTEGLFISARAMFDWPSEGPIRGFVQRWLAQLPESVLWQYNDAFERWNLARGLSAVPHPIVITSSEEHQQFVAELAVDLPTARVDIWKLSQVFNRELGEYHRSLIEPWMTGATNVASIASAPDAPAPSVLTPRQLEVLQLLAEGLTDAAIGLRLNIVTGTASRHVSDILHRLDHSNRTEAGAYAAQRGLARQTGESGG